MEVDLTAEERPPPRGQRRSSCLPTLRGQRSASEKAARGPTDLQARARDSQKQTQKDKPRQTSLLRGKQTKQKHRITAGGPSDRSTFLYTANRIQSRVKILFFTLPRPFLHTHSNEVCHWWCFLLFFLIFFFNDQYLKHLSVFGSKISDCGENNSSSSGGVRMNRLPCNS